MKKRFSEEQIIGILKQVEAGMAVAELFRQHGFSPASFYKWRAKYGGTQLDANARRGGSQPVQRQGTDRLQVTGTAA